MNKYEVHPLSITVGAIAAALILFACSSSDSESSIIPPQNPTSNTTAVSYYSTDGTGNQNQNGFGFTNTMGTAAADTVITDVSSTEPMYHSRLLVDGTPVYAWYSTNQDPTDYRMSLATGIPVPAGGVITIESSMIMTGAVSIAGYTY